MPIGFALKARDPGSRARRGTLLTRRGAVETPAFMPVGTRATVTGLTPDDLAAVGAPIVLGQHVSPDAAPGRRRCSGASAASTVHGLAGPGAHRLGRLPDLLAARGSHGQREGRALPQLRRRPRCSDLTPEGSIEMQTAIGSDIMMVLDECVPSNADEVGRARGHGADAPLGAAQPGGAHEPGAGAVRDRAGRRSIPELRRQSAAFLTRAPVRRLRHRRPGRGRHARGARGR